MMREVALWAGLSVLVVAVWAAWVWVIQWAWNIAVSPILHLSTIDLVQAFALSILIAAVTGGGRRASRS